MTAFSPPIQIDPRPLSALETQLVERLLQDPFAPRSCAPRRVRRGPWRGAGAAARR
ncbi:hypothetical protein OM076_18880 [Solirubrobacter ginsenosidimutans]|uniref:Uncharacterized protein n=1 Tax=Solirubrobacter ginsenosidimutans TaxID=490573 RepID=A0A9X3S1H2_9ACTN|nr:hypothetical protein [Solirubrobacter ginsenosidimutans]MDA0162344.1 hypothetical protein [Solirubrobacter ginsenosidimutans]